MRRARIARRARRGRTTPAGTRRRARPMRGALPRRSGRRLRRGPAWPWHGSTCRRPGSGPGGRRRPSVAGAGSRSRGPRSRRTCHRRAYTPSLDKPAAPGRSARCRPPSRRIRRSRSRRGDSSAVKSSSPLTGVPSSNRAVAPSQRPSRSWWRASQSSARSTACSLAGLAPARPASADRLGSSRER